MTLNGDVIKDGQIVFDVPRMLVPKPSLTSTFIFFDTVTVGAVLRFFKHVAKRTPLVKLLGERERERERERGLEFILKTG